MPPPRVYVTRHLPGDALPLLAEKVDLRVWEGESPPPREVLLEEAAGAHGLLTLLTDHIDADLLSGAKNLIAISNMATGYDNIDVAAANEYVVLVMRTPGVLAASTADFAFALLLAAARRLVEADRYVRGGRWRTWGLGLFLGHDIHGAVLGIIGLGGVGLEMAKRARGFGMRVLYYSRSRKPSLEKRYGLTFVSLGDLLRQADFVSLHAPLTEETHHLIGEKEFALMKPTAVIVNTARGPLVDQRALCQALEEGRIAAAALDVTETEPIPPDDPLLRLENVIITPHIASASRATRSRMAMLAATNLIAALEGRVPKDTVNKQISRRWRTAFRSRIAS